MKTDNQSIISLVDALAASLQDVFGDRCIAVYVMGSLARGGFSELASDIDIGVILGGGPQVTDAKKIEQIQFAVINNHSSVKNKVSVFWGSIESINGLVDAGRYPPFDRLDLIDHARLVIGSDVRAELVRPSKKELEVASARFALDYLGNRERVDEFFNCERITNKGVVYVTKTILFPARFIYLERTGEISGNDVSCRYYLEHFSGNDAKLVEQGYYWRLNSLPEDQTIVTAMIKQGLVQLYCNFIDIYAARMHLYGEQELKADLDSWREKLTGADKNSVNTPILSK